MNVRRVESEVLLRHLSDLEASGGSWENLNLEAFELVDGTEEGDDGKTVLKIINSRPVWKEVFEEQRKGDKFMFYDVRINGSDGCICGNLIYLEEVSGFVKSLLNSEPWIRKRPSPHKVLDISLPDIKVHHLRTVLSILYYGLAKVDRSNLCEVQDALALLQINEGILQKEIILERETVDIAQQVCIFRLNNQNTTCPSTSTAPFPRMPTLSPAPERTPNVLGRSSSATAILENTSTPKTPPVTPTRDVTSTPNSGTKKRRGRRSKAEMMEAEAEATRARAAAAAAAGPVRYPKRASSNQADNVNLGNFEEGGEERGKVKKVKQELASENLPSTSQADAEQSEGELHRCYFCNSGYQTEAELGEHLRSNCGKSLTEYYILEFRFCKACKLSYKTYNAWDFIGHVGPCVGIMRKNKTRGRKRGWSTQKSVVKVEEAERNINSVEDEVPSAEMHEEVPMEIDNLDLGQLINNNEAELKDASANDLPLSAENGEPQTKADVEPTPTGAASVSDSSNGISTNEPETNKPEEESMPQPGVESAPLIDQKLLEAAVRRATQKPGENGKLPETRVTRATQKPGEKCTKASVTTATQKPGENCTKASVTRATKKPGENCTKASVTTATQKPGENCTKASVTRAAKKPGENCTKASVTTATQKPGENCTKASVTTATQKPGEKCIGTKVTMATQKPCEKCTESSVTTETQTQEPSRKSNVATSTQKPDKKLPEASDTTATQTQEPSRKSNVVTATQETSKKSNVAMSNQKPGKKLPEGSDTTTTQIQEPGRKSDVVTATQEISKKSDVAMSTQKSGEKLPEASGTKAPQTQEPGRKSNVVTATQTQEPGRKSNVVTATQTQEPSRKSNVVTATQETSKKSNVAMSTRKPSKKLPEGSDTTAPQTQEPGRKSNVVTATQKISKKSDVAMSTQKPGEKLPEASDTTAARNQVKKEPKKEEKFTNEVIDLDAAQGSEETTDVPTTNPVDVNGAMSRPLQQLNEDPTSFVVAKRSQSVIDSKGRERKFQLVRPGVVIPENHTLVCARNINGQKFSLYKRSDVDEISSPPRNTHSEPITLSPSSPQAATQQKVEKSGSEACLPVALIAAPTAVDPFKDVKPFVSWGPGKTSIVDFSFKRNPTCPRCLRDFQSEPLLDKHMKGGCERQITS